MKFFICFLILLFLNIPLLAKAETLFLNLSFDPQTKKLTFNNEGVLVDHNTYLAPSPSRIPDDLSNYDMIVRLYDKDNNELFAQGDNYGYGNFTLTLPYFSLATKLDIQDAHTKNLLLEKNIKDLATCNGNGVCEFNKGETESSCLEDCSSSNVRYNRETLSQLEKNNGQIIGNNGRINLQQRSTKTTFHGGRLLSLFLSWVE